MNVPFCWEYTVYAWVQRCTFNWLKQVLRWLNVALADQGVVLLLGVPALLYLGHTATAVALVASPWAAQWAKDLSQRGRPRDPNELGLPSGDCMIVSIWTPMILGWWSAIPILIVMFARMMLNAHWPLDVVVGVGIGLL